MHSFHVVINGIINKYCTYLHIIIHFHQLTIKAACNAFNNYTYRIYLDDLAIINSRKLFLFIFIFYLQIK